MRNHNDKPRDIARSALASTARETARSTRSRIHGSDRVNERKLLHDLMRCADPDECDVHLGASPRYRRDIADLVYDRRSTDKLGPLIRWAERSIATDPQLESAPYEDQVDHFRKILPSGVVGDHAVSHLRWVLSDPPLWLRYPNARTPHRASIAQLVADIVGVGLHGELNSRIRAAVPSVVERTVRIPPTRLIDEEHPPPGILVPRRTITERTRNHIRFLAGAHDIDTFAEQAAPRIKRVVRELHAETFGTDSGQHT